MATYPFVSDMLRQMTRPGSVVLEIGCGPKQYRQYISGSYTGLDLPGAPTLAEPPDIAGSVEAIPVSDSTFDLVFGVATFLLVPRIEMAFAECRRVLKPDGVMLLFDYPSHVARANNAIDRQGVVRRLWDFQELQDELAVAGFTDIRDISHILDGYDRATLNWKGLLVRRLQEIVGIVPTRHWLIVSARR